MSKKTVDSNSYQNRRNKKINKTAKNGVNFKRIIINFFLTIVIIVSLSATMLMGALASGKNLIGLANGETANTSSLVDVSQTPSELSTKTANFLVAGTDDGSNTDVIMVVTYNVQNKSASILQIPRDTYVGDVPTGKINAVYAKGGGGDAGMNALAQCINKNFALNIDDYFLVNLEALRTIVDSIGGVPIYIKNEMTLANFNAPKGTYPYFKVEPGIHNFSGMEAEGFVRYRIGYTEGDVGREVGQREFFASFANQMLKMLQSNPMKMLSVTSGCIKDIKTNMSTDQIFSFASSAKGMDMSNIYIANLPGSADYASPTGERLSYYSINTTAYVQMANEHFNPYGDPITADMVKCKELFPETNQNEGTNGILGDYTPDSLTSSGSTVSMPKPTGRFH